CVFQQQRLFFPIYVSPDERLCFVNPHPCVCEQQYVISQQETLFQLSRLQWDALEFVNPFACSTIKGAVLFQCEMPPAPSRQPLTLIADIRSRSQPALVRRKPQHLSQNCVFAIKGLWSGGCCALCFAKSQIVNHV